MFQCNHATKKLNYKYIFIQIKGQRSTKTIPSKETRVWHRKVTRHENKKFIKSTTLIKHLTCTCMQSVKKGNNSTRLPNCDWSKNKSAIYKWSLILKLDSNLCLRIFRVLITQQQTKRESV